MSATGARAVIVSITLSVVLAACGHQPKTAVRGPEAEAVRALAARANMLAHEDESPARCSSRSAAGSS
jgi:hypothetical protein